MWYDAHSNYTPPPKRQHAHRARRNIGLASLGACAALTGATARAAPQPHEREHLAEREHQRTRARHPDRRADRQADAPARARTGYTATTDENHLLGRPGEYTSKPTGRTDQR